MPKLGRPVLVVLCSCAVAAPLWAVDLGVTVGYGNVSKSSLEGTAAGGFAACVDAGIPLGPIFAFTTSGGLWLHSENLSGFSYSLTIITPGVGIKAYALPEDALVRPYGGANVGVNLTTAKVSIAGYGGDSETYTNIGANALAGASYKAAPKIRVPLEVSYGMIFGLGPEGNKITPSVFTVRAGIAMQF